MKLNAHRPSAYGKVSVYLDPVGRGAPGLSARPVRTALRVRTEKAIRTQFCQASLMAMRVPGIRRGANPLASVSNIALPEFKVKFDVPGCEGT